MHVYNTHSCIHVCIFSLSRLPVFLWFVIVGRFAKNDRTYNSYQFLFSKLVVSTTPNMIIYGIKYFLHLTLAQDITLSLACNTSNDIFVKNQAWAKLRLRVCILFCMYTEYAIIHELFANSRIFLNNPIVLSKAKATKLNILYAYRRYYPAFHRMEIQLQPQKCILCIYSKKAFFFFTLPWLTGFVKVKKREKMKNYET